MPGPRHESLNHHAKAAEQRALDALHNSALGPWQFHIRGYQPPDYQPPSWSVVTRPEPPRRPTLAEQIRAAEQADRSISTALTRLRHARKVEAELGPQADPAVIADLAKRIATMRTYRFKLASYYLPPYRVRELHAAAVAAVQEGTLAATRACVARAI